MTRASFPTRGPWKILVVDDERDALDEIRPLIEADGDTCYTAVYCGPVMRHPAAPLQAANFSSAI